MRSLFVAAVASLVLSNMFRTLVGAAILALIFGTGSHALAQQADATQSLNAAHYGEFMQLSNKQRHSRVCAAAL